jgi:hypothetical protein
MQYQGYFSPWKVKKGAACARIPQPIHRRIHAETKDSIRYALCDPDAKKKDLILSPSPHTLLRCLP